jgi:hypothetical protein
MSATAWAGPPSAMSSCPAWATGVEPKTGAEMYVQLEEARVVVREEEREGEIVVVSTSILLFREVGVMLLINDWTAASSLSYGVRSVCQSLFNSINSRY